MEQRSSGRCGDVARCSSPRAAGWFSRHSHRAVILSTHQALDGAAPHQPTRHRTAGGQEGAQHGRAGSALPAVPGTGLQPGPAGGTAQTLPRAWQAQGGERGSCRAPTSHAPLRIRRLLFHPGAQSQHTSLPHRTALWAPVPAPHGRGAPGRPTEGGSRGEGPGDTPGIRVHGREPRAGPASEAGVPWPTAPLPPPSPRGGPGAGQPAAPSLGTLVCKLPLYHIITRCLGYQQISRRLGREGCSTIRKCQLAASSFCRSLNPIFLTCISATGTGPLCSDTPPGELQQEHCSGDPTVPSVSPVPRAPQAQLHVPSTRGACAAHRDTRGQGRGGQGPAGDTS